MAETGPQPTNSSRIRPYRRPSMTAVVDIACPDCGEVEAVAKVALDRYRCGECGREFGPQDVLPEADDD